MELQPEVSVQSVPSVSDRAPQVKLFGDEEWWEDAWRGMPEFDQKDLTPRHSIEVSFKTRADVEAFSKLIGQPITPEARRTRSVWYPEAEIGRFADKRYVGVPDDGNGWDWDKAEKNAT